MPTVVTPTTELEAVNECLENIGQSPVSTISGDLGVDTQIALSFVRKISRELQSKGWYWNTDYNYPLTPNGDGDILAPSNTLSIDTDGQFANRDLVQRGTHIYDRENRTFTFANETPTFSITWGFSFEELPETARRYIALKSARLFQDRVEGQASQQDTNDELSAYADLHADNLRVEDHNMRTGSVSMTETLRRGPVGINY